MSSRTAMLRAMHREQAYDLIIIGGGITGCGVAFEAAARGVRVLLLEQGDFAQGTSSRSTKLIHGGIRYLKQMDFRLVREGVRERQRLIRTAPYLVHPVQFLYPVHAGDPDALPMLRAGLLLYDWFAGRQNLLPHRILGREALSAEEPLITREGLRGGALYADCLTDDARLTVEVAKAAARHGAVLLNYMGVQGFLRDENNRIRGVEASDLLTGAAHVFRSRAVLNASGPWVDRVRQLDEPDCRPVLRPTKGVHITVEHARLPVRRPVVMHAADGRLMFAVPRDGFTYVGTTDTDYPGDPAAVRVEQADVAYILAAANRLFPESRLTEADVTSSWAGIRSLAATSEHAGPSQISRDYKLYTSRSGLVSVAGGKLTAFQAMARSIVRRMLPGLTQPEVELNLGGTPLPDDAEALGIEYGFTSDEVREIWSRHGPSTTEILASADPALPPGRTRMLAAEALYAVQSEFAVTLADVLDRRTAQMLFGAGAGLPAAEPVAQAMGDALGWSPAVRQEQVSAYRQEVAAMYAFRAPSAPL